MWHITVYREEISALREARLAPGIRDDANDPVL
jgi:hypothetical protein